MHLFTHYAQRIEKQTLKHLVDQIVILQNRAQMHLFTH